MGFDTAVFDNAYLGSQLIAYIGNKRRLLSFLGEVFTELENRTGGGSGSAGLRFGDCFAGSGSVSRLAKLMGYGVASNDWEFYSKIINTAHLCLSDGDADALFSNEGGIDRVILSLNTLPEPDEAERYISRYYAPENTGAADYRAERLFYTRENALFIDAVRNRIEMMFPGWTLSESDYLRKCALLAPLLYQAATHANTSGVFKAYHKGFGGHGEDALARIMAAMRLRIPASAPAIPGREYSVEQTDAAGFVRGKSFDICYLDPPYNQHQYGSNYFMLNTIARWDKPPVDTTRSADGSLRVKAGIRQDWVETRSAYCYTRSAPGELENLLDGIDAGYIVLSYNTEGIIPFDQLFDILSSFGKTEIFCRDYIIYRGGKQSLGRSNRNVEFQLVLSRRESPGKSDRSEIDKVLRMRSAVSLMNESFSPERIKMRFKTDGNRIELSGVEKGLIVSSEFFYRFAEIPGVEQLSAMNAEELEALLRNLEYCRCRDKQEEAEILMQLLRDYPASGGAVGYRRLWTALFNTVRKFAFRKYSDLFEQIYTRLKELVYEEQIAGKPGKWSSVNEKAADLRRIADLRLRG